ncbi:hypothetical protein CH300_20255 [Rhodococcus sp. 15-1154-1]|nr:hypothetical protein CH300_20255 [Rhodococcus sp. 15-1154-1]
MSKFAELLSAVEKNDQEAIAARRDELLDYPDDELYDSMVRYGAAAYRELAALIVSDESKPPGADRLAFKRLHQGFLSILLNPVMPTPPLIEAVPSFPVEDAKAMYWQAVQPRTEQIPQSMFVDYSITLKGAVSVNGCSVVAQRFVRHLAQIRGEEFEQTCQGVLGHANWLVMNPSATEAQ